MAGLPLDLDMETFESVMTEMDIGELDVIDEVGGDESEGEDVDRRAKDRDRGAKRSRTNSIRNSRERSKSSRNRSRSPRRYGRSRSRDRSRRRSPLKRKSPAKTRAGGAVDFLKDIQEKFGEFEGLKDVKSRVESHTILRNRARDRIENNRVPRRNNSNNHNRQQYPNNQYQNMNNMMQNPMMVQQMGMMNPMMGPGLMQMGMPFQMQMPGEAYNNGLCPPGVDPGMGFNMQPQVPFNQPMMSNPEPPMIAPIPEPSVVPIVEPLRKSPQTQTVAPSGFRNASPPARTTPIDLGNVSSRLLSENRLNLSEYLETQASSSRSLSKTIEARPLKDRTLAKCKAALHRLNNATQFELEFLHVPPAYPSDASDAIGASPIVPSKNNPVFRFSTQRTDAIQKCRPFPSVTRNIDPLIAQLGIDESVIARRLESSVKDRTAPAVISSHSNTIRTPAATSVILHSRPEMRDESCQTPVLACARCENRFSNLMNTQTQTPTLEKVSKSAQTDEKEFALAKLRLKLFQKDELKRVRSFKREYDDAVSDEDEDEKRAKPTRNQFAPPGFRDFPENNSKTSAKAEIPYKYFDRYQRR